MTIGNVFLVQYEATKLVSKFARFISCDTTSRVLHQLYNPLNEGDPMASKVYLVRFFTNP